MARYNNKRRNYYGGNSGYVGYSMSVRAAEAREEGKYPKTDFCRYYKVSPKLLAALVDARLINDSEWHHTSMYGNRTTFYEWQCHDEVIGFCIGQRATKNRDHNQIAAEAAEYDLYLDTLEKMDVWRKRDEEQAEHLNDYHAKMASDEWVRLSNSNTAFFKRTRDLDAWDFNHYTVTF